MYFCHSHFSYGYGVLHVDQLVAQAAAHGLKRLCLVDILNTAAVFDFIAACQKAGIEPVVGVEFRTPAGEIAYTLLAENHEGFAEINRHLSQVLAVGDARVRETPLPDFRYVFTIYPFNPTIRRNIGKEPGKNTGKESSKEPGKELRQREFMAVPPEAMGRFRAHAGARPELLQKAIAFQEVAFITRQEYNLHRLQRCIHFNTLLSKLGPAQHAPESHCFPAPSHLLKLYCDVPQLVLNAEAVLERCSFKFDKEDRDAPKTRVVFNKSKADDFRLLADEALEGMVRRYGRGHAEAVERLEKELHIIEKLNFEAYYLITWDIIREAKRLGFYHVGRGSGANSVVAYCLGITDVDPIELNLYFERFINLSRTSPPDFDIDFSWDERDRIYEYIFRKYDKDHVALLGAINTYQTSSVIRELGKVFGLPKGDIDQMADHPDRFAGTEIMGMVIKYGKMMEGAPHHLSIHAGGVMISDRPIYYLTPLQPMQKGFPATQFDMHVAESISFAKLDVLSQRGLGHIKEAVEIIRENRGVDIDIHRVEEFKKDPLVKAEIREAHTMGCFYIESPAMRHLLHKLECDSYLTLVAASSIIRPGVSKSGMMRQYIVSYQHPETIKYLHPKLEEILKETYGIMVYQEDVIKVGHFFAGLTLEEADTLRRGMSWKYKARDEFAKVEGKFFANCKARGYPDEVTRKVWEQITGFASFAFSKAHSASYAVESYQSLFLKTYYPIEFYVAVINNFGGFYRTEVYVHECRKAGGQIEAPCVNHSRYKTSIAGKTVWLGFIHIKSLTYDVAQGIVRERALNGPFLSLEDFARRVPTGREQLHTLIRIGAFRGINPIKKELLWAIYDLGDLGGPKRGARRLPPTLFESGTMVEEPLPPLFHFKEEDAYDQMELLGFPLCSPFDLLSKPELVEGCIPVRAMPKFHNKLVRMAGYLCHIRSLRTSKGGIMAFGCFLDREGEFLDTVHFSDSLMKHPFSGYGLYVIEGMITEEFGVYTLEARRMERLGIRPDPRAVD